MSEIEDLCRKVLEHLQTGVYLVDREQKILFWNEGAEKITGHLRQDVLGHHTTDVIQVEEEDAREDGGSRITENIRQILRDGKPTFSELLIRHKAGHVVPVRMRAVAIRNDHGTIVGAAESFEESLSAADWERRQEKLAGYGALDTATGVLSESFLLSHLRESLRTFKECQVPFSVVCFQVDRLEEHRKRYGPGVIPVILRVVGRTLENSLRPTDFLGRRGDTEFLAILTECSRFDIGNVCERLKRFVHGAKVQWWGSLLSLSISLGGTTVLAEDTVEEILASVDRSLRKSIASGGNLITVER